jgi:hypothetical protein
MANVVLSYAHLVCIPARHNYKLPCINFSRASFDQQNHARTIIDRMACGLLMAMLRPSMYITEEFMS